MLIKSHESPRSRGRNHKGKSSPKAAKRKRKQLNRLRNKLKATQVTSGLFTWQVLGYLATSSHQKLANRFLKGNQSASLHEPPKVTPTPQFT